MKVKNILLTLLLILCASRVWGAEKNIYIDDSTDPSEDGSMAHPYDSFGDINWTTGGVNSIYDWVAASDNVHIHLNKGAVWREQLVIGASGTNVHPITIQPYGTGANPLISGAAILNSPTYRWIESRTKSGEYYCELSGGGDPNLTEPKLVIKGTTALLEDTVGSLDDKSWDWGDNDNLGFNTVYVKHVAGGDPDSWDDNCEIGTLVNAVALSEKDYITIDGITLEHGCGENMRVDNSSHVNIQNCTFLKAQDSILVTSDGELNTNINITNCRFPNYQTNNVTGNTILYSGELQNSIVSGNSFTNPYHAGVELHQPDSGATEPISKIIFEHNTFTWNNNSYYGRAVDFDGKEGKCTGNYFRYNWIENQPIQSQINGNGNYIYYNIWTNGQMNGRYAVEGGNYGWASPAVTFSAYSGLVSHDNYFYNNVIYNAYQEGIVFRPGSGVVEGHVITNNIIMDCDSANDDGQIHINNSATVGNFIVTNNIIYSSETSTVIYDKDVDRTVSSADANTAGWADNIGADPLFVDAASNNFHLQLNSPAKDTGKNVSLTQDYAGIAVPQGSGVDRGAFEYQDDTTSIDPITINNGATVTNSPNVILTLFAAKDGKELDVNAHMTFSNDNQVWSDPEPYATTKIWILSPGEGIKTVYAKFRDAAGNWIADTVQDQILYEASESSCDEPQMLAPLSITASSVSPFSAVEYALDGNPVTAWSTFSFFQKEEFITLDLGELKTVSRFNMFAAKLYGLDYFPANFQIQISRDNINWLTMSSEQGYTASFEPPYADSWNFDSLICRYIRVYITRAKTLLLLLHITQIAEIEVYGCNRAEAPPILTEKNFEEDNPAKETNAANSEHEPLTIPGRPEIKFSD